MLIAYRLFGSTKISSCLLPYRAKTKATQTLQHLQPSYAPQLPKLRSVISITVFHASLRPYGLSQYAR